MVSIYPYLERSLTVRQPRETKVVQAFYHHDDQKFHLIVPATRTNINLCQLFISAGILGYPAPTLINWGGEEDPEDEYAAHLAKVQGVLDFLDGFAPEQQDDLLLMVDGYDVWFQLPLDILVGRYNALVAQLEDRNRQQFSNEVLERHEIKDSVIFGPDKLCWPDDPLRLACWAVPDSPLTAQAFGPDTDHGIIDHNRPRWLNSGTIMGSISGVRKVFAATLARIHSDYSSNSDQLYFAQLYGEQSYSRRLDQFRHLKSVNEDTAGEEEELFPSSVGIVTGPDPTLVPRDDALIEPEPQSEPEPESEPERPKEIPYIPEDAIIEHQIALDYNSSLFQTVAYYEDYLTWINHSLLSTYSQSEAASNPYHHFPLSPDLLNSGPLSATPQSISLIHSTDFTEYIRAILKALSNYDTHFPPPAELKSWSTLSLGLNTITKETFAILHFTGKKGYREMWWRRNWFYMYAEQLLKRRRTALEDVRRNAGMGDVDSREIVDGAWTAKGGWVEWRDICGKWEYELFGKDVSDLTS